MGAVLTKKGAIFVMPGLVPGTQTRFQDEGKRFGWIAGTGPMGASLA